MSEWLVLSGIMILAVSGVPGLLISKRSQAGQWLATILTAAGVGLGAAGVVRFLWTGESSPIVFSSFLPVGEFSVALDALSIIFLLPIFGISFLGSIYGLGYWRQTDHPENGRKLRLFYGMLAGSMALVTLARDGILFLVAWEIMALSAYFLITTDDREEETRASGWIYLVATHLGTLSLFALFALLSKVRGSFHFFSLETSAMSPGMATVIFALAVVGFGLKAGIMPLHVWLPSAHAAAPSHVSALLSGVLIKMGIYGIARITSLLPMPPVAWGGFLVILGAISGVLGVAFAIGQHDLKRLLAYHSIENIGIIVMGIGLALVGRSLARPDWIILGMCGALLHVWNHALFKSLLFFSAGSVIHAVHAREMDQLGGLAKVMPRTAACFLIGAVAICGLPPLNGFVSEFLIYMGLFRTLRVGDGPNYSGASFAAPALALMGALAAACFVKVFGIVFLGTPRSEHGRHAVESGWALIGPMTVLAGLCFFIGLAPMWVTPILGEAVTAWAPEISFVGSSGVMHLNLLAPLGWVSGMGFGLVLALGLGGVLLWFRLRSSDVAPRPTWSCGLDPSVLARSGPRMQYTASSFGQMLVGLFAWALRPHTRRPKDLPLFPAKAQFHSNVSDTVLEEAVLPIFRGSARLLSRMRVFQQGSIQTYLLYIFVALAALMLWR